MTPAIRVTVEEVLRVEPMRLGAIEVLFTRIPPDLWSAVAYREHGRGDAVARGLGATPQEALSEMLGRLRACRDELSAALAAVEER